MPLTSIVVIVIRMFAISWLFQAATSLIVFAPYISSTAAPVQYLLPGGLGVLAVGGFVLSEGFLITLPLTIYPVTHSKFGTCTPN